MKNMGTKYRLVIISIVIVILAGCARNDPRQFFGTWENTRATGVLNLTITNESIIGIQPGSSYTLDQLIWAPAVNNDPATRSIFPRGFYVTGTASQVNNISDLRLGEKRTWMIFLNNDRTSFLRRIDNLPDFVFTKVQ